MFPSVGRNIKSHRSWKEKKKYIRKKIKEAKKTIKKSEELHQEAIKLRTQAMLIRRAVRLKQTGLSAPRLRGQEADEENLAKAAEMSDEAASIDYTVFRMHRQALNMVRTARKECTHIELKIKKSKYYKRLGRHVFCGKCTACGEIFFSQDF